jgi:hypothetical protein
MTDTATPSYRTLAQAVGEVDYGISFGRLNERFWHRVESVCNLAQVMCGALFFAGAVTSGSATAGVLGVALALVVAVQVTLSPARRAAQFMVARRQFHDLRKRAWGMQLADLDAALQDLRRDAAPGLDALGMPALNEVNRANGHPEEVRRLNWLERCALALA